MSDENTYQSPEPIDPIVMAELVEPMWPLKPRVWTFFVVFFLAMILNLLVAMVFIVGYGVFLFGSGFERHLDKIMTSHAGFLGTLFCTVATFLTVALIAGGLSPVPIAKRLRLGTSGLSILGMVIAIFGVLAINLLLIGLDGLGILPQSELLLMFAETIAEMKGATLVLAVIIIGLGPGIAEEFLFRGYIQTRLTQRWGPITAIMVTAALFGLMHLDLVQGTFAFAMGLFLGFLTEVTGSIRPAVICHTANNALAVIASNAGIDVVWQPDRSFSGSGVFNPGPRILHDFHPTPRNPTTSRGYWLTLLA